MKQRRIGKSALFVSEIALGTMTFGGKLDAKDSMRILDYAIDHGIDFLDTAELYPVPPDPKWVFATESIIGSWLDGRSRDSVTLATKVVGPADAWFTPPIRNGKTALDRHQIRQAIEGSLRRLKTDYIDLYQIHWPDHAIGYEEILQTLHELKLEGKIRCIGTSNDSAWGLMKALQTAERFNLPRFESIQNNFSINNRRFEDALADICLREEVSLLPYSPIAGGVLSGKYSRGRWPEGSRFTDYRASGRERQTAMVERFLSPKAQALTEAVHALALELGVDPVTLAVAWSSQHDYVASTIVGANSIEQLAPSIKAADFIIDASTRAEIDRLCEQYTNPMG